MFSACINITDLNKARTEAIASGVNPVEVNNAYNAKRTELLSNRVPVMKIPTIEVKPRAVKQYCGIPVCGNSAIPGTIELTSKGFLV